MALTLDGSGSITGLSVGGLEDGIITPAELSTGAPSWDVDGNLSDVTSINYGPLAGFRNAIINGNFDHWQRGTSFTGSEYGADRWIHLRVGTTHTVTRQAFALGQAAVPGEPTYFCRTVVTSVAGAGNFALLQQLIEGVRTFAGQQVTVSFWAKADAAKPISVELLQGFGSGGSPSSMVEALGVSKVTLSTSWQKITTTVNLPSISGKTLGSNGNDILGLRVWFDAGSTWDTQSDTLGQQSGTFDIAQVQVEPGPVATPFERRPIGTELALCQRYYYRTSGAASSRLGYGYNVSTTLASIGISFPITMRTAPFALEQSGTASDYDIQFLGAATACTSVPVFTTANTVLATCAFTSSAGVLTLGQGSSARSANTNGYLGFSAEL